MSELGFVTIPRGRKLPQIPTTTTTTTATTNNNYNYNNNNNNSNHYATTNLLKNNNNTLQNGHLKNGTCHPLKAPVVPVINGGGHLANGGTGGRAIHDGFATIRSGGGKRGRSYSSPTVSQDAPTVPPCTHGCCGPGGGRGWRMEPLWEEKGEGGTPAVSRRDRPQLPWWEVATRRSRYRSCPAFSQANVVSALEQTMNSVTSRLERLASSPDLKEAEAAEIRRTAAVLRQQSSAVCQSVSSGYLSLERQLSCDSVSSVASTVSGTSLTSFASLSTHPLAAAAAPNTLMPHTLMPQDTLNTSSSAAKLKKRSWLRSSFRRAFGRNGRKMTNKEGQSPGREVGSAGQLGDLPLHHTTNTAVRHLPAPPIQLHSACLTSTSDSQRQYSSSSSSLTLPRKFHSPGLFVRRLGNIQNKQNAIESQEDEVRRLRVEVEEKERALTDCRLEALTAQHQMQAQADTIARLQVEVTSLREENMRLLEVVRGQKGATVAEHLMPSLTHTLTTLSLSSPSTSSPLTRTNSSPLDDGHPMKVMVVVGGVPRPSPTTPTTTTTPPTTTTTTTTTSSTANMDPTHLTHIGNITVMPKTTWEQLDTMVVNTLKDYGNSIDPVSALGLDANALDSYQVEEVVSGPHLPRPELLPYGYCVGDVDAVQVWLKDASHKRDGETVGNVSSAALASLTPAPALRQLATLLVDHRRLVLAGPPSVGKTTLARTLAEFYVVNAGHEVTEEAVKVFRVTGTNSLDLCHLLANTWPRGAATSATSLLSTSPSSTTSTSTSSSPSSSPPSTTFSTNSTSHPLVLVLDDLHAAGGAVETLKRYLPATLHTGPAIIATCCPTSALSTRLHIHCNFKWANLNPQQEPVRGLLGRVLRRRVAAAEAAGNTRLPDAHHLAEWLARLWLHLNTLLSGHCTAPEVTVGPGLLLDCPLGQEETQAWFLEVWNTRIVPHMLAALRSAAPHPPTLAQSWTDPLDWVLATYPWPNSVASGPDHLTRIPASDILIYPPPPPLTTTTTTTTTTTRVTDIS